MSIKGLTLSLLSIFFTLLFSLNSYANDIKCWVTYKGERKEIVQSSGTGFWRLEIGDEVDFVQLKITRHGDPKDTIDLYLWGENEQGKRRPVFRSGSLSQASTLSEENDTVSFGCSKMNAPQEKEVRCVTPNSSFPSSNFNEAAIMSMFEVLFTSKSFDEVTS